MRSRLAPVVPTTQYNQLKENPLGALTNKERNCTTCRVDCWYRYRYGLPVWKNVLPLAEGKYDHREQFLFGHHLNKTFDCGTATPPTTSFALALAFTTASTTSACRSFRGCSFCFRSHCWLRCLFVPRGVKPSVTINYLMQLVFSVDARVQVVGQWDGSDESRQANGTRINCRIQLRHKEALRRRHTNIQAYKHTNTQAYIHSTMTTSGRSESTHLCEVEITYTWRRLVRPTQSANSMVLGVVADKNTTDTCSGSMMMTSSHTTPRSASLM